MLISKLDTRELLEMCVCGVLPVYDNYGDNISRILLWEAEPIYQRYRTDTMIKRIAETFCKDISLIKKRASHLSGQRTCNALPIAHNIVLIPFKTRIPICKDDGATGYVLLSAIDDVSENKSEGVSIQLMNGHTIITSEALKTCKHRIAMAKHISDIMLEEERQTLKKYVFASE